MFTVATSVASVATAWIGKFAIVYTLHLSLAVLSELGMYFYDN